MALAFLGKQAGNSAGIQWQIYVRDFTMEPKAGSWGHPGLRLTISHAWALKLGEALRLYGVLCCSQSAFLYLNIHSPNLFNSVSIQETLADLFYTSCIELGPGSTKINQILYLTSKERQICE